MPVQMYVVGFQRAYDVATQFTFMLFRLFVNLNDMQAESVVAMEYLVTDGTLDLKSVIPQVTLECSYGFAYFTTLVTGRRTRCILT